MTLPWWQHHKHCRDYYYYYCYLLTFVHALRVHGTVTLWCSDVVKCRVMVKSNAQRETELDWTQLNCSVQFSFPLCTESATTCDDSATTSATTSAVVAGSSPSGHTCESANKRNVCRWTKIGDELRRLATAVADSWLSRTCDGRLRSSHLVAGSMHSGKLSWTQLNDPVQFSSVVFSSVFRCALGFRVSYFM